MRPLADYPNVWVKVSGMITEADWERWEPADLVPYVSRLLEWFGPKRLMFGSDWPVCELAGTYDRVYDAAVYALGEHHGRRASRHLRGQRHRGLPVGRHELRLRMSRHHYGARLHDYTDRGYRTLALENALVRVEVLADKGSDIVSFLHKPSDTDFMWHRPGGLRAAPLESTPRGVGEFVFVDAYEGGWQECFPNGGQSVLYKGAELPFHGELLDRAVRGGGPRGLARRSCRSG